MRPQGGRRIVLVAIDGLDGAGKSTVAQELAAWAQLRGWTVKARPHPSTTRQGRLSRRSPQQRGILHRCLASLFFMLDIGYSLLRFPEERRRYDLLIYVRYLLGAAYLPPGLSRAVYRLSRRLLPRPEVLVFVDCMPEEALRRIASRGDAREMFETLESLQAVRAAALRTLTPEWLRVDNTPLGRPALEPVFAAILRASAAS